MNQADRNAQTLQWRSEDTAAYLHTLINEIKRVDQCDHETAVCRAIARTLMNCGAVESKIVPELLRRVAKMF